MLFLKDHGKAAFSSPSGELSYADLLAGADGYRRLIGKGDGSRTAIFAENRVEWLLAFYGTWWSGAVNVPIDAMSTADVVRYILDDCLPDIVFHSSRTGAVLAEAMRGMARPIRLIDFDSLPSTARAQAPPCFPEFPPQQTAAILYTSGTTGGAKGVMLSFDNLTYNIESVSRHCPIFTPEQRTLLLLPLHHVLPLVGTVIAPLATGGTVVFCPTLSPQDILQTLSEGRVSIIIGVPKLYQLFHKGIMEKIRASTAARALFRLARMAGSQGLSRKVFKKVHQRFGGHLRFLVSGGAAIDPVVHRDFLSLGFDLLNGFGMTETAPMITFTRPGEGRVGSAGRLLPDCDIRFEDGEILVRGRNVMQGYYGKPDETAAVLRDGWLRTGDIGRLEKDGNLYVTGRKKELIVLSNGKKVNPEEIEKKILGMTDTIAEIGVFGRDDALHAVILPDFARMKARGILNLEEAFRWELLDAYNRTVPSHKRILHFTLVKHELPKTRLGKLKRFLLESVAEEPRREAPSVEEPDMPEYRALKEFLERQTEQTVRPDDHIEIDLGMDSLDKVTLIVFMNSTFGMEMTEQDLMRFSTVAGLALHAAEHKTRMETEVADWGSILNEETAMDLPRSGVLHMALKRAAGILLRLYFRVKVKGLDNVPRPPFIIAPNHQSAVDGLLAAVSLTDTQLRRTFFFAKEKHFRHPWLRFLAGRSNVIVMNIDLDLRAALQKMAAVLRKGNGIIVFPEGTRTRDGSVGRFKKMFAILSRENRVPIVPLVIQGAFEAWPRNARMPRPFRLVRLTFLPPVIPGDATYEELSDAVHDRIAGHLAGAN